MGQTRGGFYSVLAHLVDGAPCPPETGELALGVSGDFGAFLVVGGVHGIVMCGKGGGERSWRFLD